MPTQSWFQTFSKKINDLADSWNLTEEERNQLKNFSYSFARENYKNGNLSGIAWMKKQINKQKAIEKILETA